MKIGIVTGGTGGHIYPAIALAQMFEKVHPDCEIVFFGNDDRMESNLIPSYGYRFLSLHTSGLVGSVFSKGKAVLQMVHARRVAIGYMEQEKPDLVIGFGGYVSAPVILAAHACSIPTMLHEQNSIVGKSNQLVMNKVQAIVTCYEKCNEVFPNEKIHLLGNPRATMPKKRNWIRTTLLL